MNRKAHTNPDPAAPPPRIAALLHVVRILLAYGRHLADTIADRATAPAFTPIAACFGTLDLALILPRLQRGILRAVALERVLLARAARGRDIAFPTPRARPSDRPPVPRPARRIPRAQPTAFHTPPCSSSNARPAAVRPAAPSPTSAAISPSCPASAPAPSGTNCSTPCTSTAAASPP